LAKGPKNIVLKSNYENRSNEQYLESLGNLVLKTAEIVPHGVLVFFPSYPLMDQTLDFWRRSNIWQGIGNRKSLFIESKNVKDCNDTIVKYYERIKDPRGTGAIMFAVCRGKMSEGIDFADNYGRAVIITGLPYPPYKDPRVVLKKQYLDSCRLKNVSYFIIKYFKF
jgi:regulator of telomere elongation helicase 1